MAGDCHVALKLRCSSRRNAVTIVSTSEFYLTHKRDRGNYIPLEQFATDKIRHKMLVPNPYSYFCSSYEELHLEMYNLR